LRRFVSSQAKIIDPRHTHICAKHQRKLSTAIKQARFMALAAVRKEITMRVDESRPFLLRML
jgi:ribosomal protein S18